MILALHRLKSIIKGFSYGLTSGIITTLGLIIGLDSGTGSLKVILGGVLVIAIADAMSDAFGIHMSEEAENQHTHKEIWQATISTFVSKLVFASIFVIPFLIFPLQAAVKFCIGMGLLLIASFSFYMAREQGQKPLKVVGEHLLIAVIVIALSHVIGDWAGKLNI